MPNMNDLIQQKNERVRQMAKHAYEAANQHWFRAGFFDEYIPWEELDEVERSGWIRAAEIVRHTTLNGFSMSA